MSHQTLIEDLKRTKGQLISGRVEDLYVLLNVIVEALIFLLRRD